MKIIKSTLLLLSPLLLIPVLILPYAALLQPVLLEIFGCGCSPSFNTNDFTMIFWNAMAGLSTGLSAVTSARVFPRKMVWLRILYIVPVLILSFGAARWLTAEMMYD